MLALDMLFVQGYMQEKQLLSLWRHTNIGRKWKVGKLNKNIVLEIKKDNKGEEGEWEIRENYERTWHKLNNCDRYWVKTKRTIENATEFSISKRLRCQKQMFREMKIEYNVGGKNNQSIKITFQSKIYYYKECWLGHDRAWKVLYLFTPPMLYCWVLSTEKGVKSQGTVGTLDVLLLFMNIIILMFNKMRKWDSYWLLKKTGLGKTCIQSILYCIQCSLIFDNSWVLQSRKFLKWYIFKIQSRVD